ncbi:MAG TPA: hypothetical protein VK947_12340 [Planococcus sp. (in: firmicutes)]|nr:hypothetical protein [Planococcus sp. (in: firmicutes)]
MLIHNLQSNMMRNFSWRLGFIFVIGLLVFAVRGIWGMNTASLTPILAAGMWDTYTLARWTSLLGLMLWAGLYLAFHSFGVAFLFHKVARIPWKAALVMQAYVLSLLVMEKLLVLVVFAAMGYSLTVSMFSFGPLAATFLEHTYWIYFFNQLTVFTALIIGIQYRYVKSFTTFSPVSILMALILLHVLAAAFVASFSIMPIDDMMGALVRGGAPIE